jgi:hypothetical protein
MKAWTIALELRSDRSVVAGSPAALCDAIRKAADLRIGTRFRHNEHIDPASTDPEPIEEVAEFGCTYLLEGHWAAGIMTLRQPIDLPDGFGPRPSMSFFLYNQDGRQAIARPYLDGKPASGALGPSPRDEHADMPKYHELDRWDAETNAPSSNFIYDFDIFRYYVSEGWTEVFAHQRDGTPTHGSLDALHEAFADGREVKIGIQGLCDDLRQEGSGVSNEIFIQAGSCYYYTQRRLFIAASHPVVRVKPAIPLQYTSRGWDFGWLLARTDGRVQQLLYDPYTLQPRRQGAHYPIRWFVR